MGCAPDRDQPDDAAHGFPPVFLVWQGHGRKLAVSPTWITVTVELVRDDGTLRYFNGYVFDFRFIKHDAGVAYNDMDLLPRHSMIWSSDRTTRSEGNDKSMSIARASRLKSSMTLNKR